MTFSCPNHDFATDLCMKLERRCLQGQPGCLLEGKVKVSEECLRFHEELEAKRAAERRGRQRGR